MKNTSIEAYAALNATSKSETQKHIIIDYLKEHGEATRQQIADDTEITINAVCGRVNELFKQKRISSCGIGVNTSGCRAELIGVAL